MPLEIKTGKTITFTYQPKVFSTGLDSSLYIRIRISVPGDWAEPIRLPTSDTTDLCSFSILSRSEN